MRNKKQHNTQPTETNSIVNPSPLLTNLTSPGDYERIKLRLVELISILLESMAADPESQSMGLTAMGPVILMMIQNYENRKLHLLLTCLSGISRAVLDLDYSQAQYEEAVVPFIEGLQEALS